MDKVENSRKMSCDNPKLGIVNNNMYENMNHDPNPSILSQDIEDISGINHGPLTLLK